jgi:hypothetical protein
MISAWWLIPAMMAGAALGILMLAICRASWKDDEK